MAIDDSYLEGLPLGLPLFEVVLTFGLWYSWVTMIGSGMAKSSSSISFFSSSTISETAGSLHTVLFFRGNPWPNWTSNLSAWRARGRSGPHVERIWANSNEPFLRKVCFKNRCFTIKSAPKFQNLEKIWKKISNSLTYSLLTYYMLTIYCNPNLVVNRILGFNRMLGKLA